MGLGLRIPRQISPPPTLKKSKQGSLNLNSSLLPNKLLDKTTSLSLLLNIFVHKHKLQSSLYIILNVVGNVISVRQ